MSMLMRIVVIAACIAVGGNSSLVAIASGGDAQPACPSEEAKKKAQESFVLHAKVNKARCEAGEKCNLELTLFSTLDEDFEFYHSSVLHDFQIDIYYCCVSGGRPVKRKVSQTAYGLNRIGLSIGNMSNGVLKAKGSRKHSIAHVNRMFDMTLDGEYEIVVTRVMTPVGHSGKNVIVASNSVRIDVVSERFLDSMRF